MRRRSFLKGSATAVIALALPLRATSESKPPLPRSPSESSSVVGSPGSVSHLTNRLKTKAGCKDAWVEEKGIGAIEVHTIGGDGHSIANVLWFWKPAGVLLKGKHTATVKVTEWAGTPRKVYEVIKYTPHN